MAIPFHIRRPARAVLAACCAGVLTLFCVSAGYAETGKARAFEVSWDLCGAATHAIERQAGIPEHLLRAISIAESGRRDELNKINVAWPWTVTSGEQEWYADTKQDAIAVVEGLVRNGISNIDVGCMQINLYYHSDAFPSLEEAFDPLTNVSYAASFLRKLYKSSQNWTVAAGNYHSATPRFHNRYLKKLREIWQRERRGLNSPASPGSIKNAHSGGTVSSARIAAIDHERTAQLNAAFRKRRERGAQQTTTGNVGAGSISASPLGDSWKSAYTANTDQGNYALQAQINRLRKAADEQKELEEMLQAEASEQSAKRAADLDHWRTLYKKALGGRSSSGTLLFGNP